MQSIFHRREERELIDVVLEKARASKFCEKEAVAKVGMTIAEQIAAEARAEGAEHELRTALRTILATRFGAVPPKFEAALEKAKVETMRAWLPRVSQAETLEELDLLSAEQPH